MNNLSEIMQNTLFKYSKSLGMIERKTSDVPLVSFNEWSDNKETAYLVFYLAELSIAYDDKIKLEYQLKNIDERIVDLDNSFGYLKEKYPEHFL